MDNKPKAVMGEPGQEVLTIYVVRHGETQLNADKKLRGWVDVALNEQGHEEAIAVAKALKGVKLNKMYVSDLRRAKQTARAISVMQPHCKVNITDLLRPINFGEWNGKLLSEVEPKMLALQRTWQKKPNVKAPGGESWTSYQLRQEQIAEGVIHDHKPGEHIAIVAHLRNCVWFLAYAINNGLWLEEDKLDILNRLTQQVGRVSVLTWSKKDGWKILANNTKSPETEDVTNKTLALEHKPKS